jgi:outer membrane receptor protein involved in Fe transport
MTPIAFALALLCATTPVLAQQMAAITTQRIEIVGITPVPGTGVAKDQIAGPVQTAGADDIEASHALDLTSFMNRTLGSVHINDMQGNPLQVDVSFRGYTASPLLGTAQGLSVYVDGVRMNQPFGDVLSWDLIPKSAIASLALMPGSNPLFGLNTLGGALAIETKDGRSHPGSTLQVLAGSNARLAIEFESGGSTPGGPDWFITGNRLREKSWRLPVASTVGQLFGKFGLPLPAGRAWLSVALADNALNGNGLQEQQQLAQRYDSIYTSPDTTRNRSWLLNAGATHKLAGNWRFAGNGYLRHIATVTLNGDANDASFNQAVYLGTGSSAERTLLAQAGYSGLPSVNEDAANTPFPKWRCIAQALLARSDPAKAEPGEKCNGVMNTTTAAQTQAGLSGQLNWQGELAGLNTQAVMGGALDVSRVAFRQGSELGYVNADHSVTGVGAFGDGASGGSINGEPYDTRVDLAARTRTASLFSNAVLALSPGAALTVSARYNRSTVKNRDAILPGGGPGSLDGDHVFGRLNPALGLSFAATPAFTAYAAFNQGSRAPTAVELGCADPANPCKLPNAFAGDPPLRQVVTNTFEAGLRGSLGGKGARWNLGLFRSDNRDDILFVADRQSGYGYFRNFGRTRRQGLEAGVSTQQAQLLSLSANLTVLDATYRSAETVGGAGNSANDASAGRGFDGNIAIVPGNRLPLIPRHLLKLAAALSPGAGWTLSADLIAVGSSYARGNDNNIHQPDGSYYLSEGRSAGYAVLNLGVEWQATEGLKLFMQLNNALDRHYSSAAQLGATGFDASGNFFGRPFVGPLNADGERPVRHSTFYAPGAPRNVTLGLRLSFGD